MKRYFFFSIFLLSSTIYSQVTFTIPTWLTDILSHQKYDLMATRNREATAKELIKLGYISGLNTEYKERKMELERISNGFSNKKDDLQRFINEDCNDILNVKLPSINVMGIPDVNNQIKKIKFRRKFTRYTEFLNKVYNKDNKIPEGKRVLYTLQILEEVLNSAAKTDRL